MSRDTEACPESGLLVRVAALDRGRVRITIDGRPTEALQGDTVLTALLSQGHQLRRSDFSAEPRAGFCLMGACQDCWVSTTEGQRFRSCSTLVRDGMDLLTQARENAP